MHLASTSHPGNPERHLLIVHGYTGSSDDFDHVVTPLATEATVTTADLPGHGESPRSARYDYDLAVAALAGFVAATFVAPVHLLGHSMGGRIVLQLALQHPDVVRSLVLMGTWADAPDRGARADELAVAFDRPDPEIPGALAALDGDTGERALIVERWGEPWLDAHHAYNRSHLDPRALIDFGRLVFVGGPDLLGAVETITAPTTVLVGSEDHAMLDSSARLAAALPQSRSVSISGGFHSPQLSHPLEWQSAVAEHLASA